MQIVKYMCRACAAFPRLPEARLAQLVARAHSCSTMPSAASCDVCGVITSLLLVLSRANHIVLVGGENRRAKGD